MFSKLFAHRPLCLCALVYLGILYFSYAIEGSIKIISAVIFLCTAAVLLIVHRLKNRTAAYSILSAVFIAAGISMLTSFAYFSVYIPKCTEYADKNYTVDAVVLERKSLTVYDSSYVIRLTKIDSKKVNFKALFETEYPLELEDGLNFSTKVSFSEIPEYDFGFEQRKYCISKGIFLMGISENEADNTYGDITFSPALFFRKMNVKIGDVIDKYFSRTNRDFVKAIFIGDKSGLQSSVKRDFSRIGMSHMLAISGLHLSILFGTLDSILKKLTVDKKIRGTAIIFLSLFYMCITGFSPSITRAAIMYIAAQLAYFIGTDGDPMTSLFLAVLLICAISPESILDTGLLLSFLSTLGILAYAQPLLKNISERLRNKRNALTQCIYFIVSAIVVTLTAIVFSIPIIWTCFGQISLLSLPAALIFTYPVSLLLLITPLVFITSFIPVLPSILAFAADNIASFILIYSEKLALRPHAVISLRYPFVKWILVLFAVGILVALLLKIKSRIFYTVLTLGCASIFFISYSVALYNSYDDNLLYYVNSSKSDALITVSQNKIMICDISDGAYKINRAVYDIVNTDLYSADINAYMLTHYHKRHVATISKLLKNYYIEKIIIPLPLCENDMSVFTDIKECAEKYECEVIVYTRGFECGVQFLDITVETAPLTFIKRSTHPVIAVNIKTDKSAVLYIGNSVYDSSLTETLNLLENESDAIIFGAHGPIYKNLPKLGSEHKYLAARIFTNREIYDNLSPLMNSLSMNDSEIPKNFILNDKNYYFKIIL